MYQIYSRVGDVEVCLHDSTVTNLSVKLDSPVLTFEDSKAGTLTFRMTPNNIGYGTYDIHSTVVNETIPQTPIDFTGGLMNGTVDQSGTPIVASTALISTLATLPAGTSGIKFDQLIASDVANMTTFTQEDERTILSEAFQTSTAAAHCVSAELVNRVHNVSGQLTREKMAPGTGTDITVPSTKFLYTPAVPAWSGVSVNVAISASAPILSKLRYNVHFFTKSETQRIQLSAQTDLEHFQLSKTTTAAYAGVTYMRIEYYLEDDSDIVPSDLESVVYTLQNTGLEWAVVAYNSSDEEIGVSSYTEVGEQAQEYSCENQSYVKYRIRTELTLANGGELVPSDITNVKKYLGAQHQHRLHYYTNDETYIGASPWTSDFTLQNGIQTSGKIRCEYKYVSGADISTTSALSAYVVPTTTTYRDVVKTVDLVGRMSARIIVYRLEKALNHSTGKYEYTKKLIWEGRVVSETKDFYNMRSIKCEGDLAFFNDTYQPGKDYGEVTVREFLERVINIHNSKVSADKRFELGVVWVSDNYTSDTGVNSVARRSTNYEKTIDTINGVLKQFGGHFKVRRENGKRYLDWYEKTGSNNQSVQTINFGENLLDFSVDWDMTKLCTVVLPTGKAKEAKEGNKNAGDPLELTHVTPCQLLYQADDGRVYTEYNASYTGYKTAVAVVEPKKTYYFSGRLHGGYVAYTIRSNSDGTGDYYQGGTKTAGSSTQVGFEDFVDYKIEIPAGAHSVLMCSFGDDIQLALKKEVQGIDHYTTVDECDDDGSWHKKGSLYVVNQAAVDKYGWIEAHISKTNIETKEQLYKVAKNYLQEGQFDEMTITLSAVDMNMLGVVTAYIDILDNVRVISAPHGLDKLFPVTKIEIPIDKPAEQKITLGTTSDATMTAHNNDVDSNLLAKLDQVPTYDSMVVSVRKNASNMINTATTGYISFVKNEEGSPMELVISSLPDYTNPSANLWRWNTHGLGYSQGDGVTPYNERSYLTALTADGTIVSERIVGDYIYGGIEIRGCKFVAPGKKNSSTTDNCRINVQDGSIYTYDIRSGEALTGEISTELGIEIQGERATGLGIHARDVLCLNTDHLWIKGLQDAGNQYKTGVDVTLTVFDEESSNYYDLTFFHGILVACKYAGHYDPPEPDPEEEEE